MDNDAVTEATKADEDKTSKKPPISIRACLFFDGTANNRTNIDDLANNTTPKYYKSYFDIEKGSYEGAYSNIAKLAKFYIKDKKAMHSFRFYIEGIGTIDHGPDSLIGMGTGTGNTGVKAKVKKGINNIINEIEKIQGKKSIEYIYLDAFGFSRGAAAARHFIYAAMTQEKTKLIKRLKKMGHSVKTQNIKVKFIGLYDTVASYGIKITNDTDQLKLNFIQKADKVVQLAASDEHRIKFPLTNINSANGKGIEKFLPGVHSDIGGGYNDDASEKDLNLLDLDIKHELIGEIPVPVEDPKATARLKEEKERLVKEGWYDEKDLEIFEVLNNLIANRTVSNKYSRIPLHIMADYAKNEGVIFDEEIKSDHPVPPELKNVDKVLRQSYSATPDAWNKEAVVKEIRKIRRKYLHFSAHYNSFASKPRFTNNDKMNGQRERENHDG
ncbi:MAG: DUF2235 domain-containing protein [Desulfobacteraceae bacterium]|nr:DUF2235 domain-containing protein [Desulfobacteraceae bacterium]